MNYFILLRLQYSTVVRTVLVSPTRRTLQLNPIQVRRTVKKTPLLLEIDQRVKNNRTYCAKGSAVRTVQYYGVRA